MKIIIKKSFFRFFIKLIKKKGKNFYKKKLKKSYMKLKNQNLVHIIQNYFDKSINETVHQILLSTIIKTQSNLNLSEKLYK
jgi:hypothetical protein